MEQFTLPSGEITQSKLEWADATSSLGEALASVLGLGYRYVGCRSGEVSLRRGKHQHDLYLPFDLALRVVELDQRLAALEVSRA